MRLFINVVWPQHSSMTPPIIGWLHLSLGAIQWLWYRIGYKHGWTSTQVMCAHLRRVFIWGGYASEVGMHSCGSEPGTLKQWTSCINRLLPCHSSMEDIDGRLHLVRASSTAILSQCLHTETNRCLFVVWTSWLGVLLCFPIYVAIS